MHARSNISPVPLLVQPGDTDIVVTYTDGRAVAYGDPIESRSGTVKANLAYEVHVLITDQDGTEGIMVYVNDYDTSDDILESTGVGRVLLDTEESEALYPGVTASRSTDQIMIDVDESAIDGSVYVFIENQLDERAYQLV